MNANSPFAQDNDFASDNPFGGNNGLAGFAPQMPADGCTQCGMCLPSCPTFTKSEDPEQSPMGRVRLMRALKEGESEGLPLEKLESCLGCYSCESVCPSRVDFGNMLDDSLATLRKEKPLPAMVRKMLYLAEKRSLIKPMLKAAWLAQVTGLRSLMNTAGLFRAAGLQRVNQLLGRVSYPTNLKTGIAATDGEKHVALFTGCFGSVMEQEVQQATIDVFNGVGIAVTVPDGQGCCGALHRHNGDPKTAEKLARRNVEAFSSDQADAVVTTSSGCGAGLKAYSEWLEEESGELPVMDVSHYLANILMGREVALRELPLKVALHTPCTLRQGEGQEEAVLQLLQKIPGLEIVPLSGLPRCCGAGGSQMLSQPEMADALRDDMLAEIKSIDADVVVSSNLGCAMHLRAGLEQQGVELLLKHPVQLVAEAVTQG